MNDFLTVVTYRLLKRNISEWTQFALIHVCKQVEYRYQEYLQILHDYRNYMTYLGYILSTTARGHETMDTTQDFRNRDNELLCIYLVPTD